MNFDKKWFNNVQYLKQINVFMEIAICLAVALCLT